MRSHGDNVVWTPAGSNLSFDSQRKFAPVKGSRGQKNQVESAGGSELGRGVLDQI